VTDILGVSIVVVNYNYASFLAAAIDSALGQSHPLCEVIVVDDCSTDGSRSVIAGYDRHIQPVLREINGGEVAARQSAWPLARHPILIFLDSDDILLPHAAATVAARWTEATVKIQYPLITIDAAGRDTGHVGPKFVENLDTAMIRAELLRVGEAPSAPGSGNAYGRAFLERVRADGGFELEDQREHSMDKILECNAPFYGEVETVYEPLACYRVHDRNDSMQNTMERRRFSYYLRQGTVKFGYLARRCEFWGIRFDPDAACHRSLSWLECRLVADKLATSGDLVGEPIHRTLGYALKACVEASLPVLQRILHAAWLLAVAPAPRVLAARLIGFRYNPSQRPLWFKRVLTRIGRRKGTVF
jgi:glycosyltransferase involved in cell wall biosynthesis